MKKINKNILLAAIIFSLGFSAHLFAQENDVVSGFSAQINSDKINLIWNIVNQDKANLIRVEIKKPGQQNWELLKRFKVRNPEGTIEGLPTLNYSYQTRVKENGVYFFRVILLDANNNEINSTELKLGVSDLSEARLFQNNPNPFNPSTVISYEVLTPGQISLRVFNLTGKEIATLVDEFKQPGRYNIRFDVNNYPEMSSGIYIYKLQTSSSSDIRKMIFTK